MQADSLRELPLLRQLSQLELAKLWPDLEDVHVKAGDHWQPHQIDGRLHLIVSGKLELRAAVDDHTVWHSQVCDGEFFGETALLKQQAPQLSAVAIRDSRFITLPAARLSELLQEKPDLLAEFSHALLQRSADQADELIRLRRMLAVHVDHMWGEVEEEPALTTAAAQHVVAQPVLLRQQPQQAKHHWGERWRLALKPIGVAVATVSAVVVAYSPVGAGLDQPLRFLLAILLWAGICWMLNALPDFVVALAACIGLMLTGLASPAQAFSGFANSAWFLLIGIWCIGAAVARTGLLYRVCLLLITLLPNTYLGQSLALAITGTLLTPLFPSSQGRTVMVAPLTLELSEAMRLAPRSNGTAGLAMASFLGFGQMYFLLPNGTTTGLLAWGLLPPEVRAHATWSFWLLAALPLGVIVFVLTYLATLRLLPPESAAGLSKETIAEQLRVLGPMQAQEKISLAVILLVLGAFVSASWHGIDPTWFAIAGMLLLSVTNILTREMISHELDWSFLLFVGAILSIANVARDVHLDHVLTSLQPLLAPATAHPAGVILLAGVSTVVLRLAVSPVQAIPLLAILLIPLFSQAGYNPFAAVLTIMAASTTFAIPQLSPGYMAMLAGTRHRMFTDDQVRRLAWVHTGILLVGLVASVPYLLALKAL